jgi:two-component system, chemotaxis family, sensor kinase CheA
MSQPTDEQDSAFIAEALPAFISEAQEQTEMLEQLLLQLEDDPDNREVLDALFRCAHTVKGSAGIFGLDAVVAFTHHVETLLDRMREGEVGLTPALSTLLLQCNDQIRLLVDAALGGDATASQPDRDALIVQLANASGKTTEAGVPARDVAPIPIATPRWYVSARFGPDTFRNGMDPLAIVNYLGGLGQVAAVACDTQMLPGLDAMDPESCYLHLLLAIDSGASQEQMEGAFSFVRDDCQLVLVAPGSGRAGVLALHAGLSESPLLAQALASSAGLDKVQAESDTPVPASVLAGAPVATASSAPRTARPAEAHAGEDQRFIRVQADRLDAVINLLGELVIAGAGASLLARQTRQGTLIEANQQITRLIEEIRNGTLQLRMVPIGETFSRFRRVVRDTASELGKDVALEIVGGETELDKSVVERIADPLMHLVRNALDHGLEAPDARVSAGKTAQGTLTLSACHESGSILIRIKDDGRGISRERVLSRAWERGLVESGVTPPDAEILKLIFAPGFSTAEHVTNLSGRGVGMDVVRRNIEALRGSVTVMSEEGLGSTIEIRLPLTLAIIDGFLVAVGASKFIFPLEAVVEVIETRPTASAVDERGRSVVELRGQVLPVVNLRALYALDSAEPERASVVVMQAGGKRYGVVVDQLLGQHQTVIKPLGRMFRSLRGMSGSSILGNGEVALIFDVNSLSQLAAEQALGSHPSLRNASVLGRTH